MYSIVLATALTAGGAAPEHFHGCYGCWGGCYGCWGGCYGGWGGCCGCWGCYGCYGGCCGCFGGWGCCGCYGCWGCWGGYAYAPAAYPVYASYPVYSCYGCCGYIASASPAPARRDGDGDGSGGGAPKRMPKALDGDKNGAGEGDKEGDGLPVPKRISEARARRPATVVVKAAADVKITVNGRSTSRRAVVESFLTPDLVVGRSYDYIFKAEAMRDGKKVTRTERIVVRPGQKTEVDFRNLTQAVAAESARVTVVLPAGAKLYVNEVAVPAKGTETFQTPKLEKGRKFFYKVRAELVREGRTVTENQRVGVEAGQSVTVDFTDERGVRTASR